MIDNITNKLMTDSSTNKLSTSGGQMYDALVLGAEHRASLVVEDCVLLSWDLPVHLSSRRAGASKHLSTHRVRVQKPIFTTWSSCLTIRVYVY